MEGWRGTIAYSVVVTTPSPKFGGRIRKEFWDDNTLRVSRIW
ncbi:hypothetical protein A2U01_0100340, partial [Trifolium medium]|nr:hypothetical protein [Trifolium medium]